MSIGLPLLKGPVPRGIGSDWSFFNSDSHLDLQEQSSVFSSSTCPEMQYLSMAEITAPSHSLQLCAPLGLPPAVGWTITLQLCLEISSSAETIISTSDQSQGGLYSRFLNNRSTIVFFCMFIGFTETSWEWGATSFNHEVVCFSASYSDMKGGLNYK